jgi:Fe-S-cluster containining protein
VWLTTEDMERMAAHLPLPFDEFTRRFVRKVGNKYSLVEKFNYDCTFLTRDKTGKAGCMVYEARPMQCRTWPFWKENLKSPAAWQKASGRCPGMCDADAHHFELEHIEACRQHPESP